MSKAKTSKRAPRKRAPGAGRPPLPPEERASRRLTVRLYADDEVLLDKLCAKFELNEAEIIRRALQAYARSHRVSPR